MERRTRSTLSLTSAVLVMTLGLAGSIHAANIIQHIGSNDPLTEGFAFWPFNGGISTLALPNDNKEPAWQIVNTGASPAAQALYFQLGGTGPFLGGSGLTQPEIDDINANGFILSMRARVVSGPVYEENGSQLVSAFISVAGFSLFRFDIGLGTDGLGNTIVVIPQLLSLVGGTLAADPFGSPFLVPGNRYHLYQLSYDPASAEAVLLIDGIVMATGYPGSAVTGGVVNNNFGLAFGTANLATANFAMAKLESGQIVTTVPALGSAGFIVLGAALLAVGVAAFRSAKRVGA